MYLTLDGTRMAGDYPPPFADYNPAVVAEAVGSFGKASWEIAKLTPVAVGAFAHWLNLSKPGIPGTRITSRYTFGKLINPLNYFSLFGFHFNWDEGMVDWSPKMIFVGAASGAASLATFHFTKNKKLAVLAGQGAGIAASYMWDNPNAVLSPKVMEAESQMIASQSWSQASMGAAIEMGKDAVQGVVDFITDTVLKRRGETITIYGGREAEWYDPYQEQRQKYLEEGKLIETPSQTGWDTEVKSNRWGL